MNHFRRTLSKLPEGIEVSDQTDSIIFVVETEDGERSLCDGEKRFRDETTLIEKYPSIKSLNIRIDF